MNVVTQFAETRDYIRDLRFQAMFEGAAIGIGICQLDGRILEANSALGAMLGYEREELTGTHAGELDLELRPGFFTEFSRENGRECHPERLSSDERSLGELIRSERGWFETEKRYQRKDGSDFWGHLTLSLGRNARRQPAFLIAILADASERQRMEAHLREAETMEIIGRLAGGIAHDFNNLLTGILLYCDLLGAGLAGVQLKGAGSESMESGCMGSASAGSERAELHQHVEEVRMASEQGAALTRQLLAIARKQAAEPRLVRINEIVTSTENLLRRLIGEQIELFISLDSALDSTSNSIAGLALVDPAQLRQIILNLVLNARDAMPKGGKIMLSTQSAEFHEQSSSEPRREFAHESPNHSESGSRSAIVLTVKDDGCGMDPETRARMFEPFFTTKNVGAGTGLGMATVQRIVGEAGGRIEVESELGRGTCIAVFFPAIEAVSGQSSAVLPSSEVRSSRATPRHKGH
jgi:two-component system, cell cycle sensor histidine kinase and response regulator CckA